MELPALNQMSGMQTLMTRAYRERLTGSKQDINSISSATIRIRLPEGLILQGEFNAGAYLHSFFDWLSIACCCGTKSA